MNWVLSKLRSCLPTLCLSGARPNACSPTMSFRQPGNSAVRSVNVVVGETNDGDLNDIRGMHVEKRDVIDALESAKARAASKKDRSAREREPSLLASRAESVPHRDGPPPAAVSTYWGVGSNQFWRSPYDGRVTGGQGSWKAFVFRRLR